MSSVIKVGSVGGQTVFRDLGNLGYTSLGKKGE